MEKNILEKLKKLPNLKIGIIRKCENSCTNQPSARDVQETFDSTEIPSFSVADDAAAPAVVKLDVMIRNENKSGRQPSARDVQETFDASEIPCFMVADDAATPAVVKIDTIRNKNDSGRQPSARDVHEKFVSTKIPGFMVADDASPPAVGKLDVVQNENDSGRQPSPPASRCFGETKITAGPKSVNSDLTRQLARIEEKVDKLKATQEMDRASFEFAIDRLMVDRGSYSKFDFVQLDTRDELNEFEAKLGTDKAFASDIVSQMRGSTAHLDVKTRIARVLDCLFSRQLFASCSWTGVGRPSEKIPFCAFKNVMILLRRVVGAPDRLAPANMVEEVVRIRLRHSHKRLGGKPGRLAYCQKARVLHPKNLGSLGKKDNRPESPPVGDG